VRTIRTVGEMRALVAAQPRGSIRGLVPTMGAFHEGHLALFRRARRECDHVVVSLFVNPTQFGDPADLNAYPRDEARDARLATEAGADVLFAPTAAEMYPPGFATWVDVEGAARGLEGESRPGHFRGVATICAKLFAIAVPDVAFFGQKDAQQVAVIEQLVRDLNLNVKLSIVPTVRDADGLALSSRNVRLSPVDRQRALAIPRAIEAGLAAHRSGRDPVAAARSVLAGLDVDYVVVAKFGSGPTLAVAAKVGGVRLIDNVPLDARESPSPAPQQRDGEVEHV
jgi:pantoate--beta-alanine ligase